jgi:hypothetical protein
MAIYECEISLDQLTKNKGFTNTFKNDYLHFMIECEITLKHDNDVSMFVRFNLPTGYSTCHIVLTMTILNQNHNPCKSKTRKVDQTYTRNNMAWGFEKFISFSDLCKYVVNNKIIFMYKILECEYQQNNDQMLLTIWENIDPTKRESLTVKYTTLLKTQMDKYQELEKQYEILTLKMQELEKQKNTISPNQISENDQTPMTTTLLDPTLDNCEAHLVTLINLTDHNNLPNLRDLIHKISQMIDQREKILNCCTICLDKRKNCLFLPCGHICTCKECGSKMTTCPLCRAVITTKQTMYN